MYSNRPTIPRAAAWWVIFCVFCNCTGWALSALGYLNSAGYAAAFAVGIVMVIVFRRQLLFESEAGRKQRARLPALKRRFKRLFPFCYLVMAVMAALGGIIWAPGNPDGLTQRIPRVLHWLADGRWHWINDVAASFNTHACGFEWLMAPMFALLKTDRWVFIYNVIGFLLLPGLVFSIFRRLGVASRVAWHWMWLTPAGLCFAMQAGSIGNDAAGAVFALLAIDFALRAKESGRVSEVWLSLLAAGLMSGIKTSNLPLGLPWLVALAPSLGLLLRQRESVNSVSHQIRWQRLVGSVVVAMVAVASSLLPVMFQMHSHGGGWLGQAMESGGRPNPSIPVAISGSLLNLGLQNFCPPIFPLAGWWNAHVYKWLPQGFQHALKTTFEPGGSHLELMDMQFEVVAGLGMGISMLLLLSWICGRRSGTSNQEKRDGHAALVRWSALVSLLVFMMKMNISATARLVIPYYCLLMPLFLTSRTQETLVTRAWWKGLALAVFLLTGIMLMLNPPRPLFPARTISNWVSTHHPQSHAARKATLLYDSYAVRWDLLSEVRQQLPAEATNVAFVGYISGSQMETSLWRPFGHRRIWGLNPEITREDLKKKGITYAVVAVDEAHPAAKNWMDNWVKTNDFTVTARVPVRTLATGNLWPWYVISLGPGKADPN